MAVAGISILAIRFLILNNRYKSKVTPNTQPTWGRLLKTITIEPISPQVVKSEIFSLKCKIRNKEPKVEITQNSFALSLSPRNVGMARELAAVETKAGRHDKAAATWKPVPWKSNSAPGPDHQTPDLTAILDEIMGRPGWKENQALALIIRGTGKRVATANGGKGFPKLVMELEDTPKPETPEVDSPPVLHTVRIVFAEPNPAAKPGDRVFDVVLQGKPVASEFDIVAEARGPMRSIVATWANIPVADALTVELRPKSQLAPVLSGVEVSRQK